MRIDQTQEKRCELCGGSLAYNHVDARFCSPCSAKLQELGLTEQSSEQRFYTVREYAEEYRMEEEQVRRHCRQREILAIRRGRRWLIPRQRVKLAMPLGSNKGLSSLAAFVSSLERSYPIREVINDLTQQSPADVITKAIARLPTPAQVMGQITRASRDLPPPDEFISGIKAYLAEDQPARP